MNRLFTLLIEALLYGVATGSDALGRARDGLTAFATGEDRGQLGVFMVLVFGAVALVVVSIVLLFGMQIAGGFSPDGVSETESFSFASSGQQTYTVTRAPDGENVTALGGTVTVTENGAALAAGSGYDWAPDTGEVTILNADSAASYEITYEVYTGTYAPSQLATTDSTGSAFELFGTSVLVIPASAVLAVLIGGMVGAIAGGGSLPGMGGGGRSRRGR